MEKILKQILVEIKDLKEGQTRLEINTAENTQILKALEHATNVNKAERDKTSYDIAEIKGEIKGIRNDLITVEMVTSKNWNEIARLKSIK